MATIAAVVAAVAVIYQSWQTRRSADASKKAADAAASGLKIANSALDVARAEEQRSRALVIEAHRARMDAALPELNVYTGETAWPPYISRNPEREPWEALHPGREIVLPRDCGMRIAVASSVKLHNGSSRLVEMGVSYTPFDLPLDDNGDPSDTPLRFGERTDRVVHLKPGESKSFQFVTWTTITNWMDESTSIGNLNAWDIRGPAFVNYGDTTDSGVGVGWNLAVHGSALERIEEMTEAFRLASTPPVFRVGLEQRDYWFSRRRRIPLDLPDID
jgi:hypothetical protein